MSNQLAGGGVDRRSAAGRPVEALERRMLLSAAAASAVPATGGADPSFGTGGQALFGPGVSRDDRAAAVAVTPDGRTLVGGRSVVAAWADDGTLGGQATALARFAADGSPDPSFSDDGRTFVDLGSASGDPASVIVPTTGGRFLVAFGGSDGRVVARVNADGTLDATFGAGGLLRTDSYGIGRAKLAALPDGGFVLPEGYEPQRLVRYAADGTRLGAFGEAEPNQFFAVAAQPDGRVVAATGIQTLQRFLPDGSPDLSFGTGGTAKLTLTGPAAGDGTVAEVLPAPGGKLVAVLRAYVVGADASTFVLRLNADGSPDATFAGGAAVDTGVWSYWALNPDTSIEQGIAARAVVLSDGGIVAMGASGPDRLPTLVRVTPAGDRDAAYGDRTLGAGMTAVDVAAGPGGSVVVAASRAPSTDAAGGTTWSDIAVVRFAADGSIDASFGDGGQAVADFQPAAATATAAAAAPGGKTVVAGYFGGSAYEPDGTFLARVNADGSLDASFGDGGIVREARPAAWTGAPSAVVVRPDGRVVVGRSTSATVPLPGWGPTDRDFTLTGYAADGSPDASFGWGGTVRTDLGTGTDDVLNALLLQPDGKIVAGGAAGKNLFAVVRYGVDGRPDFSFGHFGEVLTGFANDDGVAVESLAAAPDGRIVAVGLARFRDDSGDYPDYESPIAVARYLPDGRPDSSFGRGGRAAVGKLESYREPSRIVGTLLRPDGSLVVGHDGGSYTREFGLARIDADGRLDAAYGATPAGAWASRAHAFAMTAGPGGKIYMGGTFTAVASGSPEGFVVARFDAADGSHDPTFGTGGSVKTLVEPSGRPVRASFVALLPTTGGRLMGVGTFNTADGLVRVGLTGYRTTGAPPATPPPGVGPASSVPTPAGGGLNVFSGYGGPEIVAAGGRAVYGVLGGDKAGVWSTDGTAAGTYRVAANVRPVYFKEVGDLAYFWADDPAVSWGDPLDLWRTDGTPAGTYRLATGASLATGTGTYDGGPSFAAVGGDFYFVAYAGPDYTAALYRTDGTTAGTRVVRAEGGLNLTVSGDKLYFTAGDDVDDSALFLSDGTPAGTVKVAPYAYRVQPVAAGGVVFVASDDEHGEALWRNDGTPAGTAMVVDIAPDGDGTPIRLLPAAAGGRAFFVSDDAPYAVGTPQWLWSTDGTAAGTVRLGAEYQVPRQEPGETVVVGGRLYYTLRAESSDAVELWTSDGTPGGTRMLRSFAPAVAATSYENRNAPDPATFTVFGDRLLFVAGTDAAGREVWVTDGTPEGTRMLADATPGAGGFPAIDDYEKPKPAIGVAGSAAYFGADDGGHGLEVWTTDGTPAGTRPVSDLNGGVDGSDPRGFARAGDRAYFIATDDVGGRAVWSVPAVG